MSNLPSLDSSVCVHLPKCLQTGQGDRVYDCHFVRRVTRKYFSVSGKPEWCRRMNRNVGPKGGFLSKRQSRNVFLIGRVRCKNSFLGPFESLYTPLFCFVTVRPAKSSKWYCGFIRMVCLKHPNVFPKAFRSFEKSFRWFEGKGIKTSALSAKKHKNKNMHVSKNVQNKTNWQWMARVCNKSDSHDFPSICKYNFSFCFVWAFVFKITVISITILYYC